MDRTIPFDNYEYCDNCGRLGAYDFMGDYLCAECAHLFIDDIDKNDECRE